MKKILLIISLISTSGLVHACDICGCGAGNSYIGILPDFRKHIFGLRYRYNSMLTHVGVGGSYTYLTSLEKYNTVEAWGGWTIGNKLRLMASVPYSVNERTNAGVTNSKSGIGDITLNAFYQLLNKKNSIGNKLLVQSLWLGGGIKFGTGKYNPLDKSNSANETNLFQLGTGSNDFILSGMYDVRLQDAGINISSNYKINTANPYHYQYGNKWSLSAQAYYKFRIAGKCTVAPNAGVLNEQAAADTDGGFTVTASGGRLLMGTAGVEISFKNLALGANWQSPLSQQLANGIVKAQNRCMVHLSFVW